VFHRRKALALHLSRDVPDRPMSQLSPERGATTNMQGGADVFRIRGGGADGDAEIGKVFPHGSLLKGRTTQLKAVTNAKELCHL
jgi:hypothetical protein